MQHDLDGTGCEKAPSCANAGVTCGLCTNYRLFKPGRNQGKGKRHEKKIAAIRNSKASLRRGSGSLDHLKGDVIDAVALHEGKSGYTRINAKGKASFTIQREWLLKNQREALVEGRIPVVSIHFDLAPDDELWSIVSTETLFALLERWQATTPSDL